MVSQIDKFIRKLSKKEKVVLKALLVQIESHQLDDLDIKKLSGHANLYRVRKGSIRIIFRMEDGRTFILTVERRSDHTYK
jgi:mRNA-degrading endonuclease RelE of RelBE toxin-antitoxin system